jgi:prophage endopeptidase
VNWKKAVFVAAVAAAVCYGCVKAWDTAVEHGRLIERGGWEERERTRVEAERRAAEKRDGEVRRRDKEHRQEVKDLEAKSFNELRAAHAHIAQLERDVAAGGRRLSVRASCRVQADGVPRADVAGSLGDGAGVELDAAARQDYFALRRALIADQEKINYLQGYVQSALRACGPMENEVTK